jgi:hypothetical protein
MAKPTRLLRDRGHRTAASSEGAIHGEATYSYHEEQHRGQSSVTESVTPSFSEAAQAPGEMESRPIVSFSQQVGGRGDKSIGPKSGIIPSSGRTDRDKGEGQERLETKTAQHEPSPTEIPSFSRGSRDLVLEPRQNVSYSQQVGRNNSKKSRLQSGNAGAENRTFRHAVEMESTTEHWNSHTKSHHQVRAQDSCCGSAAASSGRDADGAPLISHRQQVGRNANKLVNVSNGGTRPGAVCVRPQPRPNEDQSRRDRLSTSGHRSSLNQNEILIQGSLVEETGTSSAAVSAGSSPPLSAQVYVCADYIPTSNLNASATPVELVDATIPDEGDNEEGDRRVPKRVYLVLLVVATMVLGTIGLIVGLMLRPHDDFSIESFVALYLPQYSREAILADVESPQAIAMAFLSHDQQISSYPNSRRLARFSLATFYFALSDPDRRQWRNSTGWATYTTECSWFTSQNKKSACTSDGQFIVLMLERNSLSGALPPELELLAELREIRLRENFLTGVIPDELESLEFLSVLDLAGNKLDGNIPFALGRSSMLVHLDLRNNLLYGTIPPSLFNYSWMRSPPKRRYLQQNGNPSPSRLEVVDLADNFLSGTIPSSIGMAVNLRKLDLSINRFEGTIPGSLSRLTSLSHFGMLRWILSFPILNIDVADAAHF